MHFRFKSGWLTNGYSKRAKIEQDLKSGKLTGAEANVLLGVHSHCNQLASRPSKLDLHLLSSVYYQVTILMHRSTHILGQIRITDVMCYPIERNFKAFNLSPIKNRNTALF